MGRHCVRDRDTRISIGLTYDIADVDCGDGIRSRVDVDCGNKTAASFFPFDRPCCEISFFKSAPSIPLSTYTSSRGSILASHLRKLTLRLPHCYTLYFVLWIAIIVILLGHGIACRDVRVLLDNFCGRLLHGHQTIY